MIEVTHLTKRYGNHMAVQDLSFTIEKGIIYGFLGPNGAGKSTTMNIITGCLGATEGTVLVDGHSVVDEPIEAKKRIGYLPEQPPLYMDMTPKEYLRFVARAKGITGQEVAKQMRMVMSKTKIEDVQDRLIRNLSKGYRQRVGIAQALLGNPEVIILDEPTVGLDPAQMIEIRELIRELGKEHTLILSSHILSEVQAVCDAIMIISGGKLVASDTAENLTALFDGKSTVQLMAHADEQAMRKVLDEVDGISELSFSTEEDTTLCSVTAEEDQDLREALFMAFANAKLPLLGLSRSKVSLEDVFLELTQSEKAVQDEKPKKKRAKEKAEAAPLSENESEQSKEKEEEAE